MSLEKVFTCQAIEVYQITPGIQKTFMSHKFWTRFLGMHLLGLEFLL